MAQFKQKPLNQLSPTYRKRIESALARGLTRNQARGHAKSTELPAKYANLPRSDKRNWLVTGIKKLKEREGVDSKKVKESIKEFKELIKLKDHKSERSRQLGRSIASKLRTELTPELDFISVGIDY